VRHSITPEPNKSHLGHGVTPSQQPLRWRLALNRDRDPALAQADRTDDALAADNVDVRHGGVQVIDMASAAALRAAFIHARKG
jgi:hypothetical protein